MFLFCKIFISTTLFAFYVQGAERDHFFQKNIEEKVISLMLAQDRKEALKTIESSLEKATDENQKIFLNQLKSKILRLFIDVKAQDAFELAASQYLNQKNKSEKNIQNCLLLEPEQIDCQWLELKFLRKYNSSKFTEKAEKYLMMIENIPQNHFQKFILNRILNKTGFVLDEKKLNPEELLSYQLFLIEQYIKNNQLGEVDNLYKKIDPSIKNSPEGFLFQMKTEALKNSFDVESSDKSNTTDVNIEKIYLKKCKETNPEIVRKFFYDLDFCNRR